MSKDYYAILGVPRSASETEIKSAFRKLAHEYHPDKGGSETKFKEINEAYQVLSNREKRRTYDQFGATSEQGGGQPFGGFSWKDMGAGNQFGGFGDFTQAQQFDFGDLGDILGDMFGVGRERTSPRARQRRGNDIETTVAISFDESYFGAEKEISLNAAHPCDACRGTGHDPDATVTTCNTCKGSGVVSTVRTSFIGSIQTQAVCRQCEGTGKRVSKKCSACRGASLRNRQTTIGIKIPAGIDESRTIRLTGKGEAGAFGGSSGDLYLHVHIGTHPLFTRHDYDIKSSEEVPLSILISGGSVSVHTPTGPVQLKIPAHTKSGTNFILRDKGFEKLTGRGRGNQIVTVHTAVPSHLTPKQRKKLLEFEESLQ
ncbi:MAG: molecular chaperone DnaJ [Parcubacteria group bacterium]|nr:molecular chaperone DnaJ [Parcubacteria group bacterium]